jgi:hypothetical protein
VGGPGLSHPGIEFDPATLDLIDKDHDGRIRAPELIEACQWAVAQVRHPDVLTSGSDVLQLSNLDTEGASGAALHAEALRILRLLGREGASTVTLADVRERLTMLNALAFNGDGLLNPVKLPENDARKALVQRIMDLYGSAVGVDGEPGMGRAQLDAFLPMCVPSMPGTPRPGSTTACWHRRRRRWPPHRH